MKTNSYVSRVKILAIILLLIMALFVVRLFWLQVIQHEEYAQAAKNSQQRNFTIPAERGQIYMKDGSDESVPVVLNQIVYSVIADPVVVKANEKDKIIKVLEDVAGGEVLGNLADRLGNQKSRYEVLAKNITRSQAEKIKSEEFSGILLQRNSIRNYPEGSLGAQVLGFVNADGAGQYGVEGSLNDRLKGQDGILRTVTDVRDIPLTVGKDNIRVEAKAGEDITLTVDRNIQSFTEEALKSGVEKAGATEGSAVVMNPNSGEVLAMANFPTYNPSEFSKVENASVFMNATTMLPYEPASVIKPFLIATAIDKGAITADSTYINTDCIRVQDRSMCNTLRGLGGVTTVQEILNNSLNVGTITMARRLGNGSNIDLGARQTIYDYYHDKFGLGAKTGFELGDVAGNIFTPDSTEGNEVRYSSMTYGQGLTVTTLQVVSGFSALVNGGDYYQPTIIASQSPTDKPKPIRRTISQDTSREIRQMLVEARGSAWFGKNDWQGYLIGGKTGTAESVIDGVYTREETVATYVGFGGQDTPEYVIMVHVAAPGKKLNLEGGLHASPIFAEISNKMIDYLKIPPRR